MMIIKILLDIAALGIPAFPLVGKLLEYHNVLFEKLTLITG